MHALSFTNIADARRLLLHTDFCGRCDKLSLRTEEDARMYIGLILTRRVLQPGTFALAPYRCPHTTSKWHVGRDPRTLRLLEKAQDRRTA